MTQAGSSVAGVGSARLTIGLLGSMVAGAIFVVLTARTGTTYHLFPLLIAFFPGGLPRLLTERPITAREPMIAIVLGVAAVWLTLVLLDELPSATLLEDQPGGVAGEFVLFGLLGAALGAWWGARPV